MKFHGRLYKNMEICKKYVPPSSQECRMRNSRGMAMSQHSMYVFKWCKYHDHNPISEKAIAHQS